MTAQSPAQDFVGAVLNGRWRLVRLLGEGGMGAVYEADGPPGVGKRAIKLLHQEFVKEELILARFFAESQATRNLSHPNVAQVLETATAENGTPYLVMELLQGIPVASYTDQGQALPTAQAVHIVHGVLQALSAAHGRGIIHRDIKPDNLFLVHDSNGSFHVKVLDFGIAKVMDVAGGMGQKTRTGVLLGTPGYMSPEQIKDSKSVDGRADLWSVGIIFYELLTGTSPFPADNEFARLTSVLTEEIKPIHEVSPHLASWTGFFQRALSKDPPQRFQSADEMASALLATARGPSLRPPPTLQGPQHTQPVQPQPAPHSRAQPQPNRSITPNPGSVVTMGETPKPPPQAIQQTAAMAIVEHPSSIGPSPVSAIPSSLMVTPPMSVNAVPGHSGLMPSPPLAQHGNSGLMQSPAMRQGQSGLIPSPLSQGHSGLIPSPLSQGHSGLIPAPQSVLSHVPAVSQGSVPPPRTIASQPPPALPSHVVGTAAANVGPTHVSAQLPPGTAPVHQPTPSVEIVAAPPRPVNMAPYWVVGLVAFVAFGLGLALGILIG